MSSLKIECQVKIFTNASLWLFGSSSLNVTRYSNIACALSSAYFFFFFFSICLYLSISICFSLFRSQSLTDGWVRNHSNRVGNNELNWIFLCLCVHMYVMFASIWWDLFCNILLRFYFLRYISFSLFFSYLSLLVFPLSPSFSLFSLVDNVVMGFLYYPCYCLWCTAELWSWLLKRYVSLMIDLVKHKCIMN